MSDPDRYPIDIDPDDLRDALGDTWGEKVLVLLRGDDPVEYYAAVPGKSHVREAWPDHFDDSVWMHVNEVGYRLDYDGDIHDGRWEIRDWGDCPVSTEWEVIYPA